MRVGQGTLLPDLLHVHTMLCSMQNRSAKLLAELQVMDTLELDASLVYGFGLLLARFVHACSCLVHFCG